MQKYIKKLFAMLLTAALLVSLTTPIRASSATITFYNADGTAYKTVTSASGIIKLPSMKNPDGYTFMGWSMTAGKSKGADFEAGGTVKASGSVSVYPVMYDRSKEADIAADKKKTGYDLTVFVGDFRTKNMQLALQQEYGGISGISFVAKNTAGLYWLKHTAVKKIKTLIRNALKDDPDAKIAIVFSLGLNDLKHKSSTAIDTSSIATKYAKYLRALGKTLNKMGCDLYYMSVNPVNTGTNDSESVYHGTDVRSFNRNLEAGISGQYTFIDTYSYLKAYGYATERIQAGTDDGISYGAKTCKRIYAYVARQLRAAAD